ncbi:MAG: ABC transporter permease [Rhodovibrio sp.]|nr:ABC transporter permease [Rhodovibrio sp.]
MHAAQTLYATLAGFAIAVVFGVLLGALVGSSRAIYDAVNPLLIGFNSIPKVAVVPILVMWFGIGTVPAILTAFLISFFPIVVNVATGLATLEPELRDVLRSLGATRRDILVKVGFPRALPYFFASLKVAITLGVRGLRPGGDGGLQRGRRLPDDVRQFQVQHAARVRRPDGDRRHGHRDVRGLQPDRAAVDQVGAPWRAMIPIHQGRQHADRSARSGATTRAT